MEARLLCASQAELTVFSVLLILQISGKCLVAADRDQVVNLQLLQSALSFFALWW